MLDLDANNSNAGGVDYTAIFTENGPPVSIADTDISITDVDEQHADRRDHHADQCAGGDVLACRRMPAGITANVANSTATQSPSR